MLLVGKKRSEDSDYRPSQDLATGQIAGFNGSPASGGGFDVDELKVATAFIDEGMTMKRIKPRAKGRADRILKRSCHITVRVAES